jgi:hypothetical protein
MRKLIVLSAAVVLGGWAMSGTAAKAELGCLCTNLGKAACVSGVSACWPSTGVCVLPCDYTPAKKAKMSKRPAKKQG